MDATLITSIDTVRKHWGWFLTLGIALLVLGIVAILLNFVATIAGVALFGSIVAVAGILQIIGAFRAHGAGHVFLDLLVGVLDLVVGLIVLSHPLAGALVLTLLLATLFL